MTSESNNPPQCINTNCNRPVCYSHTHKSGTKRWRPTCSRCHMASYGKIQHDEGIIPIKKPHCENIDERLGYKCTSYIAYPGVLEIDHIDGNRANNVIDNVQTLCKNCHSYKSHKNNDFKKNKIRL